MPLRCLFDASSSSKLAEQDYLVDIVAVHDAHESSDTAWIDPTSGVSWLERLPRDLKVGRVVAYSYEASVESFFAADAHERTQRMAESLVQELRADRQFAGTHRRPIIFICHGLGGVLVKKSLIYASTRTAPKVVHLWDQFVSTFAILFFGTPHGRSDRSAWLALRKQHSGSKRSALLSELRGGQALETSLQVSQTVDHDFAPLVKQFHLFFFWEQLPTSVGSRTDYVVPAESAAPRLDNTEAAGIHADHNNMVRLPARESSDYRTVVAALSTYCEKASRIIAHRWSLAESSLRNMRVGEAWELGGVGFDVHSEEQYRHDTPLEKPVHRYFYPPSSNTSSFVGRLDLLKKLRKAFFPAETASEPRLIPKPVIVFGMGGSGKTMLCSKYSEDFKHRYAAVFTIYAASKQTIIDSFSRVGQLAGMEATEMAGRHFLSQITEPWLLIIDNADEPQLNLHELFPSGNSAHIIVTTRIRDFCNNKDFQSLEVQGLGAVDALHLLLSSADIPAPWDLRTTENGNKITKTLGYLALAVLQAGNCIFRGVCKLGEYLDLHSKERSSVHKRPSGTGWTGRTDSEDWRNPMFQVVYATFDLSLKILLGRPTLLHQDALDLLKIFAFLHFENIPVEMFSRAVENRTRAIEQPSKMSRIQRFVCALTSRLEPPKLLPSFLKGESGKLDRYRINWAISELRTLSLITFDGRYISLHPLIHEWAQVDMTATEREVWASIALNTVLESISLPGEAGEGSSGEFHQDILPHFEKCLDGRESRLFGWATNSTHTQLRVAKVFQPTMVLILRDEVLNAAKCGWLFAERGMFDKASKLLEIVRHTLSRLLGDDHERTTVAMLGLAAVYWGSGRLDEAIVLQCAVVDSRSRLLGHMSQQTIQAVNHLGRSYWLHGYHVEALEMQQTAADRLGSIVDLEDPVYLDKLSALDNLGVTLGAWRRYAESRDLHREVLEARQKLLGDLHADTLTTKAHLAMALLDLGELKSARSHITQVYEERKKQLGREHPWTLWSLCYVAKVEIEENRLEEAERLLTWGLEAGLRSLSPKHLGILMGRGELARVYARQGKYAEAETLMRETLQFIEEALGRAHPDCVFGLLKSAQLHIMQEDRIQALRACQVALERAEMRLTRKHPLSKQLEQMLQVLEDPLSTAEDLTRLVPLSRASRTSADRQDAEHPERKHEHPLSNHDSTGSIRKTPTW